MRIYKLKYTDIAVLCAVYILERQLCQTDRSARSITDYLVSKKLVNDVKSAYVNNRGRLHELQYRFELIKGEPIQAKSGGPRTYFSITKAGWEHIKLFYEKYRSPIEGQPLGDNTILKDNIGRSNNA